MFIQTATKLTKENFYPKKSKNDKKQAKISPRIYPREGLKRGFHPFLSPENWFKTR